MDDFLGINFYVRNHLTGSYLNIPEHFRERREIVKHYLETNQDVSKIEEYLVNEYKRACEEYRINKEKYEKAKFEGTDIEGFEAYNHYSELFIQFLLDKFDKYNININDYNNSESIKKTKKKKLFKQFFYDNPDGTINWLTKQQTLVAIVILCQKKGKIPSTYDDEMLAELIDKNFTIKGEKFNKKYLLTMIYRARRKNSSTKIEDPTLIEIICNKIVDFILNWTPNSRQK